MVVITSAIYRSVLDFFAHCAMWISLTFFSLLNMALNTKSKQCNLSILTVKWQKFERLQKINIEGVDFSRTENNLEISSKL